MRPRERFAARFHGARWFAACRGMECAPSHPARRTRDALQNRYSEWLNARPFRSFRFAEP